MKNLGQKHVYSVLLPEKSSDFYCFILVLWFIVLCFNVLRLKSATPVSYSEVDLVKKDKKLGDDEGVVAEVGSKPEAYTEEHEKLLGNTEKSWTLFVDGYGRDGKRIYDSFNGKTCHQCRSSCFLYC